MIEIGKIRQVAVRRRVNGKIQKTDATKVAPRRIWAQTREELGGHFGPDKHRRLIVGLIEGDLLVLYPKGTRQRVSVTIKDVYAWVLRSKALCSQLEKARARKARLDEKRAADRRAAAERKLVRQARREREAA